MPPPYFVKSLWADYSIDGQTYQFNHLAERSFNVMDTNGIERSIAISYSDHVFTRDPKPGDDPKLAFPNCSREPYGLFCNQRYPLSLRLPNLVPEVANQRVWNLTRDDSYAQLPIVDVEGNARMYAIIFALHACRQGIPYDLHLRVRSAYICTDKPPATFGDVKFAYLAKLRLEGEHATMVFGKRRKVPKLP